MQAPMCSVEALEEEEDLFVCFIAPRLADCGEPYQDGAA